MTYAEGLLQGTQNTAKIFAATPSGAILTAPSSTDSTGQPFAPEDCAHAYGYDANGLLITDTATNAAGAWVKTYTYNAASQLSGETLWVKQ